MERPASVRFTSTARLLAAEARRRGLVVPVFVSPPRLPGVARTLRRRRDGATVVAVRVRGRPFAAVVADLVEGIVAANELAGADAESVRSALRSAGAEAA